MRVYVMLGVICFIMPAMLLAGGRGTTGANFLKIGLGAAAAGQGEAATAINGDVTSVFYNPAGIHGLKRQTLSATHLSWIEGMQYEAISYGLPLVEVGTMGGSVFFLHMPPIETVDENGQAADRVQVYDLGGQLSYANQLLSLTGIKNLYAGANLKGLYRELAGFHAFGAALDLGCLYELDPQLTVGFSALNLGYLAGFDSATEALPITLRLGGAYRQPIMDQHQVILAIDAVQPLDNTTRANIGLTYEYHQMLKLRAGYKLGYDTDYLQFGGGITWEMMTLDYALKFMDVFGPTHYVSATVSFGISQQQVRRQKVFQLLDQAEALYAKSKYDEALAMVENAVLIEPKNEEALLLKNKLQTVLDMLNMPSVPSEQEAPEEEDAPALRPGKQLSPDQAEEMGIRQE